MFLPRQARFFVLAYMLIQGLVPADVVLGASAHHDLFISLFPGKSELQGRDRITIQGADGGAVDLRLSPRTRILAVRMNGRDHAFTFNRGRLSIAPIGNGPAATVTLSIDYRCRFDDPVPVHALNTDNPGFGVTGSISPAGTFILADAGWYPRVIDAREAYDLRVEGPADTVAVTTGRSMGIAHRGKKTISHWRIDTPGEGLSLSAGPYVIDRQRDSNLTAATYFFPQDRSLSPRYLETSLRYLKRYSDLFGPYPFDGFAVVENFFPTGYGFPAYTLMGATVLRLPFIPETSLPHEIVHNWWGNGVRVDFNSGNWCEGLTSYTADYLIKEQTSSTAAKNYRRQALRNYASLVSPATDFPLNQFRSRTDPASKAIGYDKCAMVFHMLRREMGDASFWAALRDLYSQFLFKRAAWRDLQHVFEHRAGRSLDRFFRQWIARAGAPQLRLADVRRSAANGKGYRITGRLVQHEPYFDVTVKLVLKTEGAPVQRRVHLSGPQTEFELSSRLRPHALFADPDDDLFRRLTPREMPPTINTLKGSTSIVMVIANRLGRLGDTIARRFSRAMGIAARRTIREADFSPVDAVGSDLLFIGLPTNPKALALFPKQVDLSPHHFQLAGRRFDESADVLFLVARQTGRFPRVVALLHPLSPEAVDRPIVKIPHYGRYSYLAFSDGQNRVKGTWAVETSPMIVRWDSVNTQ
jgi:hypothetical protein